jgi:hypothetical protein
MKRQNVDLALQMANTIKLTNHLLLLLCTLYLETNMLVIKRSNASAFYNVDIQTNAEISKRNKKIPATDTYNMLFCELVGAKEVNCLHVAKVNIIAQQKYEQQFTYIFLLLITIQRFVTCKSNSPTINIQ